MLDLATLLSRLGQIARQKGELLNEYQDHALMDEFLERFGQAEDILNNGGQGESLDYSALMYAAFCLNRCEAIVDLLSATKTNSVRNCSVGSTDILNCTEDKIFIRWMLARATWLRSKLLNYSNYYQSPPLNESISTLVVQRLDRSSRLFRILKKMQPRS